jgi:uncharacterized metal-binding protein YceD (DUF177 family)
LANFAFYPTYITTGPCSRMDAPLSLLPEYCLRLADLASGQATSFDLMPDAAGRAAIADALGIVAIKKLRLTGQLTPQGKRDWLLTADLGASVVQDCVVTLAPVSSRIDEPVVRRYLADMPQTTGTEVEMPEDDTIEPLPSQIDLYAVLTEALALALPLYPRAAGAELGQMVYSQKGVTPLTDEAAKPFAGLDALREKLQNKGE